MLQRLPVLADHMQNYTHHFRPKSWIPIWDLFCNDGGDSSIISFAGDAAIRAVAKVGYLKSKAIFKSPIKMAKTGRYLKGDQSATIIEKLGVDFSGRFQQQGARHKHFFVKANNLMSALYWSPPREAVSELQHHIPDGTMHNLIQEILA
jgi:hypothetical protein